MKRTTMVNAMVMISSTIDPIEGVLGSLLNGKDGNRPKFLRNIINEKRRFIREQNPYQSSLYILTSLIKTPFRENLLPEFLVSNPATVCLSIDQGPIHQVRRGGEDAIHYTPHILYVYVLKAKAFSLSSLRHAKQEKVRNLKS